MTFKTFGLRAFALGTAAAVALPLAAQAQQVALEEIVVTARKRAESLQEIPVAISAFSADQMEVTGAANLVDLSKFTPGIQFNEQGVQEPGRLYTAIRFRGLGSEIKEPFGQVGSAFVDGIYVSSGVSSFGTENFERVEIVKGPSSAWLGRSTFAGAVNMITKTPSTTEYSGRITAKLAEDGTYDNSVSHEGPIVEDKLAYRLFAQGYGTDGQYTASDGGDLGKERTETLSATLYATPTEELSIRFNAIYAKDNDGAPSGLFITGPQGLRGTNTDALTNCFSSGKTDPTTFRRNDPTQPNLTDFICGEIPTALDLVDSNTKIEPDFVTFWNEIVPQNDSALFLDRVGIKRKQRRASLQIDYDLNAGGFLEGSSITLLGGYGKEQVISIRDFDVTPAANWLSRDPQIVITKQYEARLASGQDDALTWLLGVSYFDASFSSQFSGGEVVVGHDGGLASVLSSFDLDTIFGRTSDGLCPCGFPPLDPPPRNSGKTFGVFGSIGYDITDQFGIDFEWRWQEDKIRAETASIQAVFPFIEPFATGGGTGLGVELGEEFKSFLPRLTLQYQPSDETNIWATYSEGNNPGFFNLDLITRPETDINLVRAQLPDTNLFVDEESLKNYELGWKQQLMDNQVNFSLVGYFMEWSNQKTRTAAPFDRPDGSQGIANIVVGGYSTDIYGAEFEAVAALTENITLNAGLNYADAEFQDFDCGFADKFAPADPDGNLSCDGNTPVQFPKWSGSFAATWVDSLTNNWDYFIRFDGTYTGKRFTDEKNFSWIGDQWLFNLRAGFTDENLRIEGFVTNLFNDKQYLAGNRWTDFSADRGGLFPFEFGLANGIALTAPKLRQFGVRAAYNF
jgi:iron complex outermembrane receptor protein